MLIDFPDALLVPAERNAIRRALRSDGGAALLKLAQVLTGAGHRLIHRKTSLRPRVVPDPATPTATPNPSKLIAPRGDPAARDGIVAALTAAAGAPLTSKQLIAILSSTIPDPRTVYRALWRLKLEGRIVSRPLPNGGRHPDYTLAPTVT